MSNDYTPGLGEVREAYVVSHVSDPPTALELVDSRDEFERFLAKVKADAVREAAYEFAEGPWRDQFAADRVDDDVTAIQSTHRWFQEKADRIERSER